MSSLSGDPVDAFVACAAVTLLIEGDADQPLYVASGALVRIGGKRFVLTAGHNVWDKQRNCVPQISVGIPSLTVITHARPGDGSVGDVFLPERASGRDPEPDVAVIEPSDSAIFSPSATEFPASAIGYVAGDDPPERLIAAGFPNEVLEYRAEPLGDLGPRRALSFGLHVTSVVAMPQRRFESEPEAGRGVHVFFSKDAQDLQTGKWRRTPSTTSMSGGPLATTADPPMLVGLLRGRMEHEDGYDQWCEPAVEAVRLLLEHSNASVRTSAEEIVARCDAARRLGKKPL